MIAADCRSGAKVTGGSAAAVKSSGETRRSQGRRGERERAGLSGGAGQWQWPESGEAWQQSRGGCQASFLGEKQKQILIIFSFIIVIVNK